MSNTVQRSFGSGEVAPGWYARTDTVRYQTGLRTCRNFIVRKEGGVTNRPGTDFIHETKNSAKKSRLIKFVLDNLYEHIFLLEFGDGYFRPYRRGDPVVSGWNFTTNDAVWDVDDVFVEGETINNNSANWLCIRDHTATADDEPGVGANYSTYWVPLGFDPFEEWPTPYGEFELAELQFVQNGDTMTIVHPDHPPYELTRWLLGWKFHPVDFGPSIDAPPNVTASSAGSAGDVWYAVTAVADNTLEESLATVYKHNKLPTEADPVTVEWDAVEGAISYNVYRSFDGQTFGLINSIGGLPATLSDDTWGVGHDTASQTGTDPDEFTDEGVDTGTPFLVNSVTINNADEVPFNREFKIKFQMTLTPSGGATGTSYAGYKVYIDNGYMSDEVLVKTSTPITAEGDSINGPISVEDTIRIPDDVLIDYPAPFFIYISPMVKAPSGSGTADVDLDATNSPDDTVTWLTQSGEFDDIGEDADMATAPPVLNNVFATANNYPRAVAFAQQRQFYGGTRNNANKVWGSQIGRFKNFNISTPLLDTDAVSFGLVGPQDNSIRHLIEIGKLLVMTSTAEMRIDGDDSGIIRPDALNPGFVSDVGSKAANRPLKVADTMLFVQARGKVVRSLRPLDAAGQNGYAGTDLAIYAAHLFKTYTIVDWDYAKNPDSIVWIVRSDGVLLGLTYLPELGVWGWHRHDTDGFVESVCVIPEDDEDRVYMIVKRTIDGQTKRYIERMAIRQYDDFNTERQFFRYFNDVRGPHFADCAKCHDGWNNSSNWTATLTSAGGWTHEDLLTITMSIDTFDPTSAGVHLIQEDGELLRVTITEYVSSTVARGFAERTVPAELRNVATMDWGLAITMMDGLEHLEGKAVSIAGDEYVMSSPNNSEYPTLTVEGGEVSWPTPLVKVVVGLPYISDLQTLDMDTASGPSMKEGKRLVNKVGLFVQESQGIFAGKPNTPTADDPLAGLLEYKARDDEEWGDPNAQITDSIEVGIESSWDSNGRVFVRQVDPRPLTILSITPIGYV